MDDGAPRRPEVWRPGVDGMDEDEELEYDPTVYDCLHAWSLEWPCLSFDVVRDELGEDRTHFPHSMFMVAGTQAVSAEQNALAVMRLTRLKKTRRKEKDPAGDPDDSDASESDSSDDEGGALGDGPLLRVRKIAHHGAVNRVRCMPQRSSIVATWSDAGVVQVWDTAKQLGELMSAVDDDAGDGSVGKSLEKKNVAARVAPKFAFTGHGDEGYAIDWSPVVEGRLVSGDNQGVIHVAEPRESGWAADASGARRGGHGGSSVEDLQWSPAERDVFASCGADGRVCVWDARVSNSGNSGSGAPALSVQAHGCDVNVMSWNNKVNYMLATGADDGGLRIWDLRALASGASTDSKDSFVANFQFHRAPVTSVEWARFDGAMLASSAADHTVCVWDLAVERDAEEEAAAMAAEGNNAVAPEDLPPQLMFVHQGLRDPKEIHWHHQIPGMCLTTAADGFNAFKAYNVGNEVA
jgi:ribosome assembly protein RRB1